MRGIWQNRQRNKKHSIEKQLAKAAESSHKKINPMDKDKVRGRERGESHYGQIRRSDRKTYPSEELCVAAGTHGCGVDESQGFLKRGFFS
jgi:hypothetical protein